MPPLVLTAEVRYVLYLEPDARTTQARAFATAAYLQETEGKHWFHRLCFQDYGRDADADPFRERVPKSAWSDAFVTPDAPTVRGLMDLSPVATLGIDPGLEFSWRKDRTKLIPSSTRMKSESVVLSVPTITA